MPRNITNIHDKFIKQILTNKELATEFLNQYLPEALTSILDFTTLAQQDTSYITDGLKTSYSDLIWGVKIKGKESLQITLLLEHKSSADPNTTFQLLEYLALGYQKQIREKKKPELIVPILYYHGKRNWKFKSLEKYFITYPDALKKYLPVFSAEFINLSEVSSEQIYTLKNRLLSSAIMLQKYCFDPEELAAHIGRIVENLDPYLDSNITETIFVYLISGVRLERRYLVDAVKKLPGDMNTKVMTIYDQLILEGKELGLAEGLEKGLAKGKEQALAESLQKTVLNAYDAGIDISTLRIITGESEEKIYRILRQNRRIR